MLETRFVTVGRARLALHLAGKGPLAVLVHGYPLDHRMWLDVLHSDLTAARRLCAIDLRGHGDSPWAGDPVHAMDLLADDIAAVIRMLGDEPADIVALSMGGYVALALWERFAACVRTLTLVDTRADADSDAGRTARTAAMANTLQHGRRWLGEQMLTKLVAAPATQFVRARLTTMMESTAVETILADLQGMRDRPDRRAMLGGIHVPALVVVGEHDVITPPADAEVLANGISGAELVVIPAAGHMSAMEAPAAFATALAAFWDKHSPQQRC
jgi:pimeloyl-ACP methyl ester carboxylesterase